MNDETKSTDQEEIYENPDRGQGGPKEGDYVEKDGHRFRYERGQLIVDDNSIYTGLLVEEMGKVKQFRETLTPVEDQALVDYVERNFAEYEQTPGYYKGVTIGMYFYNLIFSGCMGGLEHIINANRLLEEFRATTKEIELEKVNVFTEQEKGQFEKSVEEWQDKVLDEKKRKQLRELESDYAQLRDELFAEGVGRLTVENLSEFIERAYEQGKKENKGSRYTSNLASMILAEAFVNTADLSKKLKEKMKIVYSHPYITDTTLQYFDISQFKSHFNDTEKEMLIRAYLRFGIEKLYQAPQNDPNMQRILGLYQHTVYSAWISLKNSLKIPYDFEKFYLY